MIRRDAVVDGREGWILLSQIEHARVSGELASQWGGGPFLPLSPREVVLPAIYRHDDGWRQWEAAPEIVPTTGQPRAFTEMPLALAHEIWGKSIEGVADLGPLGQFIVASHFLNLRQQSSDANELDSRRFLRTYQEHCRQWLDQWLRQSSADHTPGDANRAVAELQLFDTLSLLLCCREPTEPAAFPTPSAVELTVTPLSSEEIQLAPWPLAVPELELTAKGQWMPRQEFGSDEQFAAARTAALAVELKWRLRA